MVNGGYLTLAEPLSGIRTKFKIPNQEALEEFRSIVADYARLDEDRLHAIG
ncbi:MAG: hypothetical protein FWF59_07020 [Turicibacter sp.]|nr:hypothetical protein [Turicibacter sp.]